MRFDFKAAFHQVVDNPDPNVYFLSEMKLKLNESINISLVSMQHQSKKLDVLVQGPLTISK